MLQSLEGPYCKKRRIRLDEHIKKDKLCRSRAITAIESILINLSVHTYQDTLDFGHLAFYGST